MAKMPQKKQSLAAKTSAHDFSETDPNEPHSSEDWNKIVDCVALDEILLVECRFAVQPGFFSVQDDEKQFILDRKASEPAYDGDACRLVGGFEFSVDVKHGDDEILSCKAKYVVVFSLSDKVDEVAAKRFAKRVGRNAAYPYFREFAASQSWASGTDIPILPILKTPPAKKKNASAQSGDAEEVAENDS